LSQADFEARYRQEWKVLEQWLNHQDQLIARSATAKKNKARKDFQEITLSFPDRYRQLCHHVSLARSRNYSQVLVDELNTLAVRAHHKLYEKARRVPQYSWMYFAVAAFPIAIWQNRNYVIGAGLVFFLPLFLMALVCYFTETGVYSVMSYEQVAEFRAMYSQAQIDGSPQRYADTDITMFGFYIFNNIGVAFRTFAGGLLFGVGAFFFLAFNGVSIGAVAGYLTQVGLATPFFSFVAGHSSFELIAIVLSGAAGFKLGDALFKPGCFTRMEALRRSALQTIPLMYGVGIMLVVAAGLEAFWSSASWLPPMLKYGVGIGLWLVVFIYCCSGYWFVSERSLDQSIE